MNKDDLILRIDERSEPELRRLARALIDAAIDSAAAAEASADRAAGSSKDEDEGAAA